MERIIKFGQGWLPEKERIRTLSPKRVQIFGILVRAREITDRASGRSSIARSLFPFSFLIVHCVIRCIRPINARSIMRRLSTRMSVDMAYKMPK